MKTYYKFLVLILVLILVGCSCVKDSLKSEPKNNIDNKALAKIMSYNIHSGKDINNVNQLRGMADYIKSSKVDIVGLQEVDSVCMRSGNIDQTEMLASASGLYYKFARHFEVDGGAYGLALLSKFPIENLDIVRLPIASDPNHVVIMMLADISINDTLPVKVVNVHMDYRSQESRERQAEFIVDLLKSVKLPIVFLGDFNALSSSPEVMFMKNKLNLKDMHLSSNFTFPANAPNRKIDHILTSSGLKVANTKVDKVLYSDHLPILTDLVTP